MKGGILLGLASLLLFGSAVEAAKGDSYVGADLSIATIGSIISSDASTMLLTGKYGYYVHKDISIQGRIGFGITDDDVISSMTTRTFETPSIFGAYGVYHYDINPSISVHGLLGFSIGTIEVAPVDHITSSTDEWTAVDLMAAISHGLASTLTPTEDITSLTFGVGASYLVTDKLSGTIEYVSYLNGKFHDLSSITFGATYKL